MSHVHFFLNPKGGTGKSTFSSIMAQYLMAKGFKTTCIDCDPATPTLIAYEALHALRLDIMDGNNIEKTKFDAFVELIMAGEEDEHFIIDNGTSSFVALSDYLLANDIVGLLSSMGHFVTFHVIVVCGDNLKGTTEGFQYIINKFGGKAKIFVWLNPFFGKIEKDGKAFEEFKAFTDNQHLISAIVRYPDFPKDMFGKSFARLQKDRLTFAEVCDAEKAPDGYDLMTRHRLGMIRKQAFAMLDASRMA